MSAMQRRVVCAALRFPDGLIVCGPRHYDLVMHAILDKINSCRHGVDNHGSVSQGFVDQWGEFMDRQEARRVAEAAGQLNKRAREGARLYSEDLY